MTTPNDPTMSHDSLDAVIAAYMLAVEAGEVPNRQELLDKHPEHADALRALFADLDRMDRVASPLRLADGLDARPASKSSLRGGYGTSEMAPLNPHAPGAPNHMPGAIDFLENQGNAAPRACQEKRR